MSENSEKKSKKVNRLTLEEINKKIEEYESSGQTNVKYYEHLLNRKKELGA